MARRLSVAAIISKGESILMAKRFDGGDVGGLWELVGGKVDPGESPSQALERELMEELGVPCLVGPVISCADFIHHEDDFFVIALETRLLDLEIPTPKEHSQILWVPVSKILQMDLVPSDRKLLNHYLR